MPKKQKSGADRVNILSAFHTHPNLTLPGTGPPISLEELLERNPNYFLYKFDLEDQAPDSTKYEYFGIKTEGYTGDLEIIRSNEYLEEEGILLEARMSYASTYNGRRIEGEKDKIIDKYTTEYISKSERSYGLGSDNTELAVIQVPTKFDSDILEDSIENLVTICKNLVKLDMEIHDAVSDFAVNN